MLATSSAAGDLRASAAVDEFGVARAYEHGAAAAHDYGAAAAVPRLTWLAGATPGRPVDPNPRETFRVSVPVLGRRRADSPLNCMRGHAHFRVSNLDAVKTAWRKGFGGDDLGLALELRNAGAVVWTAYGSAWGVLEAGSDGTYRSPLDDLDLKTGCYAISATLVRRNSSSEDTPLSNTAVRRGAIGDEQACGRAPDYAGSDPRTAKLSALAQRAFDSAYSQSCALRADVAETWGMTGANLKHLLCDLGESDLSYLEIGVLQGSTMVSFANGREKRAIGVDNWSEFADYQSKPKAERNVASMASGAILIDADAWDSATPKRAVASLGGGKFDIFFYDGGHSAEDHYAALPFYLDTLAKTFIFLVDDWDEANAQASTLHETVHPIPFDHHLAKPAAQDFREKWNSGLGAFVLSQSAAAADAAAADDDPPGAGPGHARRGKAL
ncbi:hypothetical protein M885DRAFT_568290 [Pelagophyceae sp. CCMP2097]|nr:hypothetical protein M885DRAFT_568290 [Pelagophyceae sp. CCMP2097]